MKTEMKHTKGKWLTDRPSFEEITVCTEKMDICTVLCIDIDEEEAEANAKLIAAAPELLNACDAVLTTWHSKLSNMHKKEPAYLQQIRDAINKATL